MMVCSRIRDDGALVVEDYDTGTPLLVLSYEPGGAFLTADQRQVIGVELMLAVAGVVFRAQGEVFRVREARLPA